MSILETLNDIGINPVVATSLMKKLNLSPDELDIPEYFNMFKDVAQFFSKYENAAYVISKVTYRHTDNMLQKLYEYVDIQKRREQTEKEMSSIDGEIKILGTIPEAQEMKEVLAKKKLDKMVELNQINKEVQMYER